MGYESKLYIGEKAPKFDWEEKRYVRVVAVIDLCKCYPFSDWMRKQPETDCYFCAEDGDTEVLKDRYGKPLTEASVEDVLEHLIEANKADDYRRYHIAIDMLQSFVKHRQEFGELAVLHYGY